MLIQFDVGNYKSFKDIVSFSMIASTKKEHIDTHVFKAPGNLKLLKSAVLYGANASGKSNLFIAMRFMRRFVLESSKDKNSQDKIPTDIFRLSSETENKPSYFQMIFIKDNIRYRYGFEVNNSEVVKEWLFHTTRVKNEVPLFIRENQNITVSNVYTEGVGIEDKTRKNALFLSVVAQFNGAIAEKILEWFVDLNIISGLNNRMHSFATTQLLEDIEFESMDEEMKEYIVGLLKEADLGIVDIDIKKRPLKMNNLPPGLQAFVEEIETELPKTITNVLVSHHFYNEKKEKVKLKTLDLDRDESHGTQKLFYLLGPVVIALSGREVLVVDELDCSFHPLITKFIVELFHYRNDNAQLIFNTHDTNLLNNKFFRRDQVWFVEKDAYGASVIYSLVDFNVRNDASFEKDYLQGRYGSVPYLGSFKFDDC
jgi:AAA15 family ATPase/GTPase